MKTSGAKLIATHMLLPAWWVRAFEASLLSEHSGRGAVEQALSAQLAPALSPLEMGALAAVIGAMQEQILEGSFRSLKLDMSRHVKEAGAGAGAKTRRFAYEKVAQLLTCMKVLEPLERGPSGHPLFSADHWTVSQPSGKDLTISLDPGKQGIELLLGLSDAHADLLSHIAHEQEAKIPLGSKPPLMLWKSLWLELMGTESLLYMRLERAMQWDFKWLQLDGTFGLSMSELYRGLEHDFAQQLRTLSRLGKRFQGHGFVAPVESDHYLAFSRDDDLEPTLVWQIGRERLASEALNAFRFLAQRSLVMHHFGSRFVGRDDVTSAERLIRILLRKDCGFEDIASAKKVWDGLLLTAYGATKPADFPISIENLEHTSSQMLSPVILFFELLLRSETEERGDSSGPFPIPETLIHSPLGPLFDSQNQNPPAERLQSFARILQDAPDLIEAFRTMPLATLTSPASRSDRTVMMHLEERSKASPSHEGSGKPLLVVSKEGSEIPPKASQTPLVSEHSAPLTSSGQSPLPKAALGKNASTQTPLGSSSTSRMLKIASDELQKIKKNHPDQYAALKKAYLDSLDEGGRKLIFDVQKRMQTHLFEEHLRQRLLRFMVEHPGAWRSAETSYAKNP